jgi:hypothetical protein
MSLDLFEAEKCFAPQVVNQQNEKSSSLFIAIY